VARVCVGPRDPSYMTALTILCRETTHTLTVSAKGLADAKAVEAAVLFLFYVVPRRHDIRGFDRCDTGSFEQGRWPLSELKLPLGRGCGS
jgi:hypothetical protein